MSDEDKISLHESLVLIIGCLTEVDKYLSSGYNDQAIVKLERAKSMIDETIEDLKDE